MFRRLKSTINMYNSQGAITFEMTQALLKAATDDVEELSEQLKATVASIADGVTIEFHSQGSIMEFVMGKTKVCPIKARLVLDDRTDNVQGDKV